MSENMQHIPGFSNEQSENGTAAYRQDVGNQVVPQPVPQTAPIAYTQPTIDYSQNYPHGGRVSVQNQYVPQYSQPHQVAHSIMPSTSSYAGPIVDNEQVVVVSEYRDHVAAGLLGIFLGMFGVHKFFLGYTQAGFITLAITVIGGIFTLGVASFFMAVIGVIEGILYMSKSQFQFEKTYIHGHQEWF